MLPSQQGFGEDLQASNVIMPIIDLTPTAEGSVVRADLQRAFSFGSITSWTCINATTTIANSPGFYRIIAGIAIESNTTGSTTVSFALGNGFATKNIYAIGVPTSQTDENMSHIAELDVFLAAGESVTCTSSSSRVFVDGSVWQIADVNGNLNNPSGFNPQ